jgi:thioredoxin 1
MNKNALVVIGVVVLVAGVAWLRRAPAPPVPSMAPTTAPATAPAQALPKLVDLGATTCIPCKQMAPILEELKREFAGRMDVEFIDVRANPAAAKPYRIKLMPTQVFLDAAGRELYRHEGFYARAEILAKWKELGVDLTGAGHSGAGQ